MKNLSVIFFVALFAIGIGNVNAQEAFTLEQKQEIAENVSQFIYDLNLSEREKPAFRHILEDFFVGLVAIRVTDFSPKTNRSLLKTLIKERDARAKNLLSKEQYKVYRSKEKEIQGKIKKFLRKSAN